MDRAEQVELPQTQEKTAPSAAMISVSQSKLNHLIGHMNETLSLQAELDRQLHAETLDMRQIERLLQRMSAGSVEVQSGLRELGMVEIQRVFSKMQRLAHRLLTDAKKQADIIITGGDVSLDASLSEVLSDMLMHVVRNAVDHGLEPPEERAAQGKTVKGQLRMEAQKRRDGLRVIVSDDGRGVQSESVLAAAERKGLLTKPREEYSRDEIFGFLLRSGFTTKTQVTTNSGRGVGLDAVSHMVDKIGGRLRMTSAEGEGTRIELDLPLTLTNVEALRLEAQGRSLYIPVSAVNRLVPLRSLDGHTASDIVFEGETYRSLLGALDSVPSHFVLLSSDAGRYFMPCEVLGEYGTFLVLPLPSVLERILGRRNIYSGCIQDRFGRLSLLLDVDKLIRSASEQAN